MSKIKSKTNITIGVIGFLSFFGILLETAINVIIPTLTKEFHTNLGTTQWLTTGYLLLVTFTMITTAFLLKMFHIKKLFITAVFINLIGCFLCILAPNFFILLIGRLLQAISTGISTPLLFFVINALIPSNRLGTYIGFAGMLISLAPSLGPTYGGLIESFFSWRLIFWIIIPFLLLILLIGLKKITFVNTINKTHFDYIGFISLIVFLGGIEVILNQLGNHSWNNDLSVETSIIIIAVIIFTLYNYKGKYKIADWSILRKPLLSLRLFNYFTLQFSNIGLAFLIPIFAQNFLDTNSFIAGLVLFPGSIIGSFLTPFAGRWYDKTNFLKPLITSDTLVIIGAGLFLIFTQDLSVWLLLLFFLILRIGFNIGFSNTMSDASKNTPFKKNADQSSIFQMTQQYAGSIGTAIMSLMVSLQERLIPTNQKLAYLIGSRLSFSIVLILAILSLIGTLISKKFLKN